MSEDTKVEETAEAVADDSVVEEPVVEEPVTEETLVEDPDPASGEPESAVPPDPGSRAESRRGTSPVSWLALFLSFITLAAVGYMIMEDRRTRDAAETSSDSIAQQSHVQSLQQSIEERGQLLDSLPGRMSNLENSVSALQGVSAGARDTWLLAEAEYYMQIANAQLQLGNNPHLAMLALAMADERVVQMANPALTDVRRAIADELAELEVMQKPDIEGTTLTLASLSRVVESLPMSSVDQATVEDVEATDEELGATARAWESVKGAMSGLVRVTPPDEETRALLTPDTAQLVRSNLALQLQAARLALLRGEQAIFEQSLDDADALLTEYFDAGSAQVIGAKETLAEIRDSMVAVAPPDISESLRLLRQFRTLSENGQ
jgi:uncharacterized protein HemX